MAQAAEETGEPKPLTLGFMRDAVRFLNQSLGLVTGSVTLFGMIATHFGLQITAFMAAILRVLRDITHPIVNLLVGWLPYQFTDLQKDLIVVYLALAGVMLRTCYRLVEAIGGAQAGQASRSQGFCAKDRSNCVRRGLVSLVHGVVVYDALADLHCSVFSPTHCVSNAGAHEICVCQIGKGHSGRTRAAPFQEGIRPSPGIRKAVYLACGPYRRDRCRQRCRFRAACLCSDQEGLKLGDSIHRRTGRLP
jgi:hypothetical protein